MIKPQEATMITLKANPGKENELAQFLSNGATVVRESEPNTLLWSALKLDNETFGIFDIFPNSDAREAHFAGKVAAALSEHAPDLIQGGWENGVLKNIENSKILASKVANKFPAIIKNAIGIDITARLGKEEELKNFLIAGAELVEETEPDTLYWFALQIDESRFKIFDLFPNQSGVDAHFAGKVASALNENAANLVEGGWEKGIVKSIKQFEVIKTVAQY